MSRAWLARIAVFALLLVTSLPVFAAQSEPWSPSVDDRHRPTVPFSPDQFLPDDAPEGLRPPVVAESPRSDYAALPWARIAYYARGKGNWDLHFSDDYGWDYRRLTSDPGTEIQPDLIRGGTRIVYAALVEDDFEIFVVNTDGNNRVQLTSDDKDDVDPAWAPDGRIAFTSYRDGQPEIYVMSPTGANQTRLTTNPDFDGDPAWSPDGKTIAFSSRRNGGYRIWTMNADGSGQTQVTDEPGGFYPAWSPDGKKLAYSADKTLDGWLDLRMITLGNPTSLSLGYGGPGHDQWAGSWSPDGRFVSATSVGYVQYQGQWYINRTSLYYVEASTGQTKGINQPIEYAFEPSWASIDLEPPTSRMNPLPAVSPGPLRVGWSANDRGIAGVHSFDVQMSTDNGPWTELMTGKGDPSMSVDVTGGRTYAFRVRARDKAGNVEPWPAAAGASTTIEALAPVSTLQPLPAFSRIDGSVLINWSGAFDRGGSGITGYIVQQRIDSGPWKPWKTYDYWHLELWASYAPQAQGVRAGQSVHFRVSAADKVHNVEPWPADPGDTGTTFYRWLLKGTVTDNTGTPVKGAAVTADPDLIAPSASSGEGGYVAYLGDLDSGVRVTWAKDAYGALPATPFESSGDVERDVVLPPADDVVANGNFEAPALSPAWELDGSLSAELVGVGTTGAQALSLFGSIGLFNSATPIDPADGTREVNTDLYADGTRLTEIWKGIPASGPRRLMAANRVGGEWTAPAIVVNDVDEYDSLADGNGEVHVIARLADQSLVYARQQENGDWAAPELVPNATSDSAAVFALDADRQPYVVWRQGNQLSFSRRNLAGNWSAVQPVIPDDGGDYTPRGVAVGADGVVTIAYTGRDGSGRSGGFLSRRLTDGTLEPRVVLHQGQVYYFTGPIAGPDGRLHVLWDSNLASAHYAVSERAGGAGKWERSDTPYSRFQYYCGLRDFQVGPDNAVHILAVHKNHLTYARKEPGQPWSELTLLDDWKVDCDTTDMALDGNGLPHVVSGGSPYDSAYVRDVYYMRQGPDGAWMVPVNVTANNRSNSVPQLAFLASGPHITYLDYPNVETVDPTLMLVTPVLEDGAGFASATQTVAIPAGMNAPVLSLIYHVEGSAGTASTLEARLVSGDTTITLPMPSANGPNHVWIDASPLAGTTATLTLRLDKAANTPPATAIIDDVSLGSASPDLWAKGYAAGALPGGQAVHTLTVGNRGAIRSGEATLTYQLPPELTFVSADPPPSATSPLRWSIGALAGGETRTIRVTVAVSPSAKPLKTVKATLDVSTPWERETLNNASDVAAFIGRRSFLPHVARP